jgi:soluble lytic murein transglycosylase
MKAQQLKKWAFVVTSTFTLSLYAEKLLAANIQTDSGELPASKPSLKRLLHARELLGPAYTGSLAEKSALMPSITRFVYNTFQDRFDGCWKKHASNVSATILAESEKKGIDPLFVMAVIQTESQFDPSIVGKHGEIGLMQIKPETAKWIAEKEGIRWKGKNTLRNPAMNVKIGIAYMDFLRKNFDGAARHYVAAYNMGPTNVRRLASQSIQPREYPTRVMSNYNSFYSQLLKQYSIAQL